MDGTNSVAQPLLDCRRLGAIAIALLNGCADPTAPVTLGKFQSVTTGSSYSCGLTTTGAAYCWGDNLDGNVGDGTQENRFVPTAVIGGLTFQNMAVGRATCGLTATGSAYAQLGDGTTTPHLTPTAVAGGLPFKALAVGFAHTCGIVPTGAAYCWGDNSVGQMGDGTVTNRPTPVAVSGGLTFTSLAAGIDHTCGTTPSGVAYCWGANPGAELGDGTTTNRASPVAVRSP